MTIHSMLKVYHILASLPFVQANKFLFVGIREFLQVFFLPRDTMLSAVYAVVVCLCVCLYVCVLYQKRLNFCYLKPL